MARAGSEAEEIVLRLREEVSGPAAVAGGAAADLTQQIEGATAALRAMQGQARVEALGKLEAQVVAGTGALKAMQAEMRLLQKGPSVDIVQYQKLKGAIDGQTVSIARAKGEHAALAGFAKKSGAEAAAGAKAGANGLDAASSAAKLLGGSSGAAASSVISFGQQLAQLGPYGIAAGIALAVAAAGVIALVAVFSAGLQAAGAFRDELLKLQGAFRGNAQAGKEAQSAINAVAGSAFNALPRDKLADYATQLGKLRLRGTDLTKALEAAAIAGSAAGDEMATSVIGAAGAARMAGQSMDKLADRTRKIWGGVAASQAYSLGAQINRMKEDLNSLFAGATIDPFLSGMKNITSMFGQSTESGQRLQKAVSGALDGMLAMATAALPYVKGGILGVMIAGINMYIAFKKTYNVIRDLVGPIIQATGLFGDATLAIVAGQAAMYAFAAILLVAGVAAVIGFAPLLIVFGALGLAIYVLVEGVKWIVGAGGRAVDYLVSAFRLAKAALGQISLADIAENMINSFVAAIKGSVVRVGAALSDLGGAARDGLKAALGIRSPSRVAIDAADNVTGTFAARVEDAAPEAQASFRAFADPAAVKSEAKGARGTGGAKIVYIEIHNGGTGKGDDGLLEKLRELLRREFDAEVQAVEPV